MNMDLIEVRALRAARTRDDLRVNEHVRPLAGGTWLYSEPQPGLEELVDLMTLGWTPVDAEATGGLRIAATCTIAQLLAHPADPAWGPGVAPLFRRAAESLVASWKIWNAATVGGNVCMALPAGAMTSLTSALDGEALIWQADGGERRLPITEFVTGVRTTALSPGEVLRRIDLPAHALRARVGFRRSALAPLGRSGAIVIARRDVAGSFVATVTAATTRPHRVWFAAPPTAAELREAIEASVAAGDGWYDDAHGAPDWRRARTLAMAEELRLELTAEEAR
tara:strand:- start:3735 stop:4577 length:843 start_codon:yes stop_codon:yes gene_type:complete